MHLMISIHALIKKTFFAMMNLYVIVAMNALMNVLKKLKKENNYVYFKNDRSG